jgi:hypothetical protein
MATYQQMAYFFFMDMVVQRRTEHVWGSSHFPGLVGLQKLKKNKINALKT